MHLDISIVTLTVILPHISIAMQQPDSYYSSVVVYLSLLFLVYILHIISMSYNQQ